MRPFFGGFFGSWFGFLLLFLLAYYLGSSYPQYGQTLRAKMGL